ncbi:glycoside hydrolase family 15 protein [Persicobacter diffluens]
MTQSHTYDFGIVGNCAFMASIDKRTNVVWMCWPSFDSSFVFGSLLDSKKGGEFTILPVETDFSSHQYYMDNTNILVTEIEDENGKYRVTDFAPRFPQYDRYFRPLMLIRKVEPLSGNPRVNVRCAPKGDYGAKNPERVLGSNHIKYLGIGDEMRLTTNIPLSYVIDDEEPFFLNETKYLVLTYGAPLEAALEKTADEFLRATQKYWQDWVKSTSIGSFHQKAVIRSALALKIHQFEDTGAIIAASTTSLPESPGSGRNWDYRFCWMRDTFYTLQAFNHIGHFEESERYFNYIANISSKEKDRFQPLYSIKGKSKLEEKIIDLEGYLGNGPVRIGNQAHEHIQNDVYGQVMISLLPLFADERFQHENRFNSHDMMRNILKMIDRTIDEKDASLWEFRDRSKYYCYTFLFQWAGSSAALKIASRFGDNEMMTTARELKKKAFERIEACYDDKMGVYTQAAGSPELDAANLQLIMMGYLDSSSSIAKTHLKAMEKELRTKEGLFYRYKHIDDFGAPETTFLICAFWYVEALAVVGRVEEAIIEFEKLLKYTNHLGLLSEDVDAKTGSQWGNFPQAYSHVGLINAAYRIATKLDKPMFF